MNVLRAARAAMIFAAAGPVALHAQTSLTGSELDALRVEGCRVTRMVIGKARIRFDLPKGEMVRIRYSETVNLVSLFSCRASLRRLGAAGRSRSIS